LTTLTRRAERLVNLVALAGAMSPTLFPLAPFAGISQGLIAPHKKFIKASRSFLTHKISGLIDFFDGTVSIGWRLGIGGIYFKTSPNREDSKPQRAIAARSCRDSKLM
jgi:hypothetical protein